ncbi:DUF998 domain-containing protein [Tahibacter amnicola]|uniref:DUF998 domain-containing protein n=1 Tax=Tahibacter amnicola TaxID=2976241 RepID=A0ABY6BEA7_9GAMM|nr:DUF998 domain-containing protein [Tahibacter amnicola]UXI68358.1 DUF998 domain-containing protein [Tahibacter amnicola]
MSHHERLQRGLCGALATAPLLFLLATLGAHLQRPDLVPWQAPMSAYLTGPGGAALRAAYCVMAFCIPLAGLLGLGDPRRRRHCALPVMLFGTAGLALLPVTFTALAVGDTAPGADLTRLIHGLAAQTTFLCLVAGIGVQTTLWGMERDRTHRPDIGIALAGLALATYVVMQLGAGLPRGLVQKTLVLAILLWLQWAAWQWRHRLEPLRSTAAETN